MHYDLNSDELLDERNFEYPAMRSGPSGASHHGHLSRGGRLLDDQDFEREEAHLRMSSSRYGPSTRIDDPRTCRAAPPLSIAMNTVRTEVVGVVGEC